MKTKEYVELWSDKDVDEMVHLVWKGCCESDCDACEHRLEVDDSTCHVEIIEELWRKWKNASDYKTKYQQLLQDVHDYQGSICCYCKNYNRNNCEHFCDLPIEDGIPLSCGKFMWRHEER